MCLQVACFEKFQFSASVSCVRFLVPRPTISYQSSIRSDRVLSSKAHPSWPLLDLVNCGRQIQHFMAFSGLLFVISAATAAAAHGQELSGEICLYARIRKVTEMVFSFNTHLNTITRKTEQGNLTVCKEVKNGLQDIFHGYKADWVITTFLPEVRITTFIILI